MQLQSHFFQQKKLIGSSIAEILLNNVSPLDFRNEKFLDLFFERNGGNWFDIVTRQIADSENCLDTFFFQQNFSSSFDLKKKSFYIIF